MKIRKLLISAILSLSIGFGSFLNLKQKNIIKTIADNNPEELTPINNENGSLNIYLYAFLDNGTTNRWNSSTSDTTILKRTFRYTNYINKTGDVKKSAYVLDIVLYAGDYFCPFIAPNGYAVYGEGSESSIVDPEVIDGFKKANLSRFAYNSYYCFKANKNGTYHIEISNSIETCDYDGTGFYKIWNNKNESFITYDSHIEVPKYAGDCVFRLTGMFSGKELNYASSTYDFSFNKNSQQYIYKGNFKKGDYFRIYAETKKTYIYCATHNYANSMYESAGIIPYESNGGRNFKISISGYYEIALSGIVEELAVSSLTNEIWKEQNNSYIRFLGSSQKNCYVYLGEHSNCSINLKTTGKVEGIYQYSYNGLKIEPNNMVEILNENLKGKIFRISYDENYSDKFTLTAIDGENKYILTENLVADSAYSFSFKSANKSNGLAASFLYKLSDSIGSNDIKNINYDNAKALKKQYSALNKDARKIVDKARFGDDGTRVNVPEIIVIINDIASIKKQIPLFLLYFVCCMFVLMFFGFVLLASKRKNN